MRQPSSVRCLRLVGTLFLTLACACSRSDRSAAGPADWQLDLTPVLAVGDTEDSDSAMFGRVSDVRLLPNGTLAVADAGASAVLLFDSTGAPLGRRGRKGRGPGEFAGQISLARLADDAVAVWDPSQSRWSQVHVARAEITVLPDSLGDAAWAHAGVIVLGEGLVPEWAPSLLRALADSMPAMKLGFLDETALLWVNRDAALREWMAYAGREAQGRITLPANYRPMQFRADRVVGLLADSIGLERVVVYRFARPADVVPSRARAGAAPIDSSERGTLMSSMRNAVVAQEMHYATAGRYTARADSLSLEMPPGMRLQIIDADGRAWRGAGVVSATGFTCGMYVGLAPPRGWREGAPRCAW
ncbi:hypothetical protein Strain138_002291 [Pseudogemmatithrix spongiicola]|uniref:6-bladed beta-propeller n=1 Tax=Pseudogemmatithrix spongiicola TaxID=3062599 RepID=A0AA49K1X1_9BACT|nr:hypothetical protein Strain138_002291 [Gemmatimonadaceae bacterium 'strain 138']WKW15887.1 hypothetical protein Strain318_002290 [Gemmatimonadaceae bacterium 'strain 318']